MKDVFAMKELTHAFQLRDEPENFMRAARVYWTFLLCGTALLIFGGMTFGAWQFFAPPETIVTETAGGGITGFNRAQLTAIVESYEKRQATFEKMMSGE